MNKTFSPLGPTTDRWQRRQWLGCAAAGALGAAGWLAASPAVAAPKAAALPGAWPVEEAYAAAGPLPTTQGTVAGPDGQPLYEVFAPRRLGNGHPVIAWGNGTGSLPPDYAGMLHHLASWGFVVIDVYNRNVGSGAEILGSVLWLAEQNDTPGSPFAGHLDMSRVGAAGHSQGATGVLNAATQYPDSRLIRTVVPIALPFEVGDDYDTASLVQPCFILGGTKDRLISPPSVNVRAFEGLPDAVPGALGMLKGADHVAIMGNGGRQRGYLTAWMRGWLQSDSRAAQAFYGPSAELLRNTDWTQVRTQAMGT